MGKGKRNRQLHIEDAVGAPAKHQNKTKKQFVWPKWAKIAICAVLLVAIIGGIVAASLINSGIVYRNRILVESKSGKFDVNQQMAAFILWQTVYQQAFYEYYYTSWGMYQDTNKILENYLSANDYAVISATSYVSNYLKTGINSMEDYLTEMVASADAALEAGLKLEAHDKAEAKAYVEQLQAYYAQFRNEYVQVYNTSSGVLPSTGIWAIRANLAMSTFQNFLDLSIGDSFKASDIEDAAKLMIMYSKYSDYISLEYEDDANSDMLQDFILRHPAGHFETKYFSFTNASEAMVRNFFSDKFIEERYESTVAKHFATVDRLAINDLKGDELTAKLEELGLNNAQKYTKSTNDEGEATYSPELVEALGEYIFSSTNKTGTFAAVSGEKCAYLVYFKENSTDTEATVAFKEYKYEDYKDNLSEIENLKELIAECIKEGKNTTEFKTDNEKADDLLAQMKDGDVELPDDQIVTVNTTKPLDKDDTNTAPKSILNALYAKDASVFKGWMFVVNDTTQSYVVKVVDIEKNEEGKNTTNYTVSYFTYTDDLYAAVLSTFEAEYKLYLLDTKVEAPTYSMEFDAFEEKVINWLLDENYVELVLSRYANEELDALLAAKTDSNTELLPAKLTELFGENGVKCYEKKYALKKELDSKVYDYIFNSKNKNTAAVVIGEDDRVFLVYVAPENTEDNAHEGHDHGTATTVEAAIKEYNFADYEANLKVSDAEDAKTFREQIFADLIATGRKDTTDYKSADDLAKEELDALKKTEEPKNWPTDLQTVKTYKPASSSDTNGKNLNTAPDAILNKIYPSGQSTTKVSVEAGTYYQVNDNGTSYVVKVLSVPASDDKNLTCEIQYQTFEDSEYYSYFRAIKNKLDASLKEDASTLTYPESITDGSYQDWLLKGEYKEAEGENAAAHVFDRQKNDLTFIATTDSKYNVTSLTIYIVDKPAEQVKTEEAVVYGGYLSFATEKEANKAYKKLKEETGFSLLDKFTSLQATTTDADGHESVTGSTVDQAFKKSAISEENVKNWLFDANRKANDIAVVQAKDGKSYYLVIFISTEATWLRTARTSWIDAEITEHLDALVKDGGYTLNEDSMAKIEDLVTTTAPTTTTTK